MSRSFSIYLATAIAVISLSRPAEGAGPEVLAKQMADGNRAAIAAVRSLSCGQSHEVVSESRPGQAAKWLHLVSGQYWRSPDRIRVQTPRPPDEVHDLVLRNRKIWVLSTYTGTKGTVSQLLVDSEPHLFVTSGDVWEYALFHHWGAARRRENSTTRTFWRRRAAFTRRTG